jgi:hypothetical protein
MGAVPKPYDSVDGSKKGKVIEDETEAPKGYARHERRRG